MKSRGPIVAAAASLILSLLVAVLLILPKTNEVKTVQEQVATEQVRTATLQTQVDYLESLQAQADKLRAQLKALNIEIPPTADLPGLIHEVNAAADQAAVDLSSITPGSPSAATTNPVSVVPLQLTVSGGFFSVEEFLYRIETLDRTAKVSSVSLTPNGSSSSGASSSSGVPSTPPNLTAVVMVNFFTTDMESGPGSSFGHQGGTDTATGSTTTTTTTSSESAS
jgi:Tfp pilus assembly protein PilO